MSELSTQNQTTGTPNIKVLDNRGPPRGEWSTRRMHSGEGPRISNQGCYPALPIKVESPELKRPFPFSTLDLICFTLCRFILDVIVCMKSEIKGPWRQSRAEICDQGTAPGSSFLTILGLLSYLSTYEASWYTKHNTMEKPANLVCAINESINISCRGRSMTLCICNCLQ